MDESVTGERGFSGDNTGDGECCGEGCRWICDGVRERKWKYRHAHTGQYARLRARGKVEMAVKGNIDS